LPITLPDDGVGADAIAGDGVYSAAFWHYNADGTYVIDITARVSGGSSYAGESLFISVGDPSNRRPVPDFAPVASATAVVSGVPNIVSATIEYGPETST
jgi:hypothetical protein